MSATEEWSTIEKLLLTHVILKEQKPFVALARTIRQTSSIAPLLSHKRSFFTPKNCAMEYASMVASHTGEPIQARPRSADFHITLSIENELRKKRISELESLIAQSNTKIKFVLFLDISAANIALTWNTKSRVIEDDIVAINNASDEALDDLLEKMQVDTDQQTENSEETDPSDNELQKFLGDSTRSLGSLEADSLSDESEATDSFDSGDDSLPMGADLRRSSGNFSKYMGKSLSENLMSLCKFCWRHPDGRVFRDPVTDEEAPGYSAIIPTPIDLSTIKRKIFSDEYIAVQEIGKDFDLMFTNAQVYNEPGSTIYLMAGRMMKIMRNEVALLEEAVDHDANPIIISIPARKRRLSEISSEEEEEEDTEASSSSDGLPPSKKRKLNATVTQ